MTSPDTAAASEASGGRDAPAAIPVPSLRGALLRWLLLPLVVLVPLAAVLAYTLALQPALDALDHGLTDTAVALSQILVVDVEGPRVPVSPQTARALRASRLDETDFAVAAPDGRVLAGTGSLLAAAPKVGPGEWRYREIDWAGRPARAVAHGRACGPAVGGVCTIVVAETLAKRGAAERAAILGALLGAGALALPLVALALLAARRGLAVKCQQVISRNQEA